MSWLKHIIGLLCLLLILCAAMRGQSFNTTVGGSQTYDAYGLQTEFKWHNLSGWTGLGFNDGVKVGAYVNVPLARGYRLGVGDQMLSGYLDVDEYDTHAFTVRGVSMARETKDESVQFFSGFLTAESDYPFLHMSSTSGVGLTETKLIAILYKHKLSDALRLRALTLYGSKFTSIESMGWTPSKKWGLAGAAGIGSGAMYFAGKGEVHLKKLDAQTSYTVAGKDFHRQEQPYYSSEPLGLNARLTLNPATSVKLLLDHEKTRMYIVSLPSVIATFNSASLYATFKGFQLSPSVSTVSTSNLPGQTLTDMFSASRRILPRWRAFGAYINMKSPTFKQSTIVVTNEFRVNTRLAILQNYNRMNEQNNFSFGAQWLSNRISFSVDQQVYISALAPTFGGKSVFQAWTFNVRVRTPHGTSTNINTFVAPDGRMQWGGYLSGLRYNTVGPVTDGSPSFSKYIISGLVVDETGNGVWGVAIQIGGETVISDSDGGFFIHVKNSKPQPLSVLPESSLQTSRWSLTSAPPAAQGFLEGKSGAPVRVVVQIAGHVPVQKSAPNVATQPPPKTTVPPANDQVSDPPTARPVAVQKPAPALMIEPQLNATVISVNDQVRDLQRAEKELIAVTAPRSEKNLNVHHAGNRSRVLRVLCCLMCFGWHGRTHRGTEDAGESRA